VPQELQLDGVGLALDLAEPLLSPQPEDGAPHEADAVPHLPAEVLFLKVVQFGFPVLGIVLDLLNRRLLRLNEPVQRGELLDVTRDVIMSCACREERGRGEGGESEERQRPSHRRD
jgi:hypothetical protein